MTHRTALAGALTAGLALTGLAATTAPAHAASWAVTIKVSDTSPDLKDRVTIKGAVTPAAPGKPVLLQVRYAGRSGWKTLDRTKLNQAGKYRFDDKVKTAREREYRVVKPAQGRYDRSVSAPQEVTVYRWKNLTSVVPTAVDGFPSVPSLTLGGVTWSDGYAAQAGGAARTVVLHLNRTCTDLWSTAGLLDTSPSGTTATVAVDGDGTQRWSQSFGTGQVASVRTDITDVVRLSLTSTSANGGLGGFANPRVRCSD